MSEYDHTVEDVVEGLESRVKELEDRGLESDDEYKRGYQRGYYRAMLMATQLARNPNFDSEQ